MHVYACVPLLEECKYYIDNRCDCYDGFWQKGVAIGICTVSKNMVRIQRWSYNLQYK